MKTKIIITMVACCVAFAASFSCGEGADLDSAEIVVCEASGNEFVEDSGDTACVTLARWMLHTRDQICPALSQDDADSCFVCTGANLEQDYLDLSDRYCLDVLEFRADRNSLCLHHKHKCEDEIQ